MLWFERLNNRLGSPLWLGAVIIGWLPFFLLSLLVVPLSGFQLSFSLEVLQVSPVVIVIPYLMLTTRYVRRRMEELRAYALSMSPSDSFIEMNALYGLRGALASSALFYGGLEPVFFYNFSQYTLFVNFLGSIPYLYFNFIAGTFLWVLLYSSFSIYRMGKLPLRLKPFTEDKSMGLKLFGATSLRFTASYLGFAALFMAPLLLSFGNIPSLVATIAIFLFALILFTIPLISLRRKLAKAKRDELNKTSQRYTRVVRALTTNTEEPLDPRLQQELMTVRQIREDINQIQSWPFDVGSFARLSAIVLTVAAIILGRILQLALHLAT